MIKTLFKLALAGALAVGSVFMGYIIWVINPFNMPAIFKRNYPEAFEKFPLSVVSPFIKIY